MKRPLGSHPLRLALGFMFVVIVVLAVLVVQLRSQLQAVQAKVNNTGGTTENASIGTTTTLTNNLDFGNLLNETRYDFAQERVVVDVAANAVYLPEFRIKLPYDDVSKTIAYGMRTALGVANPEGDVTSTVYIPPMHSTQIACFDLVRLKIEAKQSPYNPNEKPTTVSLADGRKLQVYEAMNESECVQSWNQSIKPATIAAEFQKAQSY